MTLSPTKLAAARLAAAEVFIAEGLVDPRWTAERLRRVAAEMDFRVRYPSSFSSAAGEGSIDIHVDEQRGEIRVRVEPRHLDSLSPDEAVCAADQIRSVAKIARKVESAIALAVDEREAITNKLAVQHLSPAQARLLRTIADSGAEGMVVAGTLGSTANVLRLRGLVEYVEPRRTPPRQRATPAGAARAVSS